MGRATNDLFSQAIATQHAYVQYAALVSSGIKTKNKYIVSTLIRVSLSILVSMSAFVFAVCPKPFKGLS